MLEGMLQAVVVVFMLFLCALCLFAVVVIVRDIISENAKSRREREREDREWLRQQRLQEMEDAKAVAVVAPVVAEVKPVDPDPEPEPEPEPEPVVEEEPVPAEVEEPASEEPDTDVSFNTNNLTIEDKYAALPYEFKVCFNDIVQHALSKEGVKEIKHTASYDYKIGAYRVVRIMIKRGEIVCEFNFIDREVLNYANASNVRMKQSATALRVSDVSAVDAVKEGIDLVCTQIAEDKEYKKQLAKEKRREKRKQAAAEAQAAEAEQAE